MGRRWQPQRGSPLWLAVVAGLALLVPLAGCGPTEDEEGEVQSAVRITYQAAPEDGRSPSPDEMEAARSVIERRLDATGLAAFRVGVEGPDTVIVEAAPAGALETVRALAGTTGRLDLVPLGDDPLAAGQTPDPVAFPAMLSSDAVAGASIGADETGGRTVDIALTEEGRQVLAEHTMAHLGEHLAIVLDGRVVVTPVINAPIADGTLRVTKGDGGGWALDEAQQVVTLLQSGALPFPLRELGVEQP